MLDRDFFERDVHTVARELIGCALTVGGAGGVIVETEAYNRDDPACHAYRGPTERNAPLFEAPGHAYVYLSYGIHSLLNAVAEPEGEPAAVLIRALEPVWGVEAMIRRRRTDRLDQLCSGPGKLTQALGVGLDHNRAPLDREPFEFALPGEQSSVVSGPRIGISVATDLPWRYCAEGSRFVSRPWPQVLAA
jgi:DNA-3-methyladenine glycosylase